MHVSQLKESKFLKKEDVGRGKLVTIAGCTEENVAKQGAPEELKWCLHFEEEEKPMVLNSTNGQIIAKITGSEDSDGWIGQKIVLYDDPNVSFGGKITGGIRVRAPKPGYKADMQAQNKAKHAEAAKAKAISKKVEVPAALEPGTPCNEAGEPVDDVAGDDDVPF